MCIYSVVFIKVFAFFKVRQQIVKVFTSLLLLLFLWNDTFAVTIHFARAASQTSSDKVLVG